MKATISSNRTKVKKACGLPGASYWRTEVTLGVEGKARKGQSDACDRAYLEEPVAGFTDDGKSHGTFGHGQLAVLVSGGGPS